MENRTINLKKHLGEMEVVTIGEAMEQARDPYGNLGEKEWEEILNFLGFNVMKFQERRKPTQYLNGFFTVRMDSTAFYLFTWKEYRVKKRIECSEELVPLSFFTDNNGREVLSLKGRVRAVGDFIYVVFNKTLELYKNLPSGMNRIFSYRFEEGFLHDIFETLGGLFIVFGKFVPLMGIIYSFHILKHGKNPLEFLWETKNPFIYGCSGVYGYGEIKLYIGRRVELFFENLPHDFFANVRVIHTGVRGVELLMNRVTIIFDAIRLVPLSIIDADPNSIIISQSFILSEGKVLDTGTGDVLADLSPLFKSDSQPKILGATIKEDMTGYYLWVDKNSLTSASKIILSD